MGAPPVDTSILGAGVIIGAIDGGTGLALTRLTLVAHGAGVAIVAATGDRGKGAAILRVTSIRRADVAIVAAYGFTTTDTIAADIALGTGVVVVAGVGIQGVETAILRVAGIGGARVEIVAGRLPGPNALPPLTDIGTGALVAIVAGSFIVSVFASRGGVAQVIGADVRVVAIQDNATTAGPVGAGLAAGTGVAVIAAQIVGQIDAALSRHARIRGARVVVVARQRITS